MQRLLAEFAALPEDARPTLIWRETSPQHFHTAPAFSGRYNASDSGSADHARCAPHDGARAVDSLNRAVRPLLAGANVSVLPVWKLSAERWGEHFEGGDCTHFCMPSGVFALWTRVLAAHLLRS